MCTKEFLLIVGKKERIALRGNSCGSHMSRKVMAARSTFRSIVYMLLHSENPSTITYNAIEENPALTNFSLRHSAPLLYSKYYDIE